MIVSESPPQAPIPPSLPTARGQLRTRQLEALVRLLDGREELRGVSDLADHLERAVRWCA